MRQIVMLVVGLFTILSFDGCSSKEVICVKPTKPKIEEAVITQCKSDNILENTKCTLMNYINVKEERDKLRLALDKLMN